jgi:hypothetical protein
MDDRDIDRLLDGTTPQGDPDLAQFADVFEAMGEAYPEPSTEALAASHLAAMIQAAHLLAENGEPATRPASKADGPASRASGLPKRRRMTLKELWATKGAKVAAIALAAVLALGGTAFAGVLPQPVQNLVATAAGTVGIALPSVSTTATFTVPPGYAASHSGEVSATIMGTIGTGPGNSSHEATHGLVPGNNGLHLGWAIGRHLGWAKMHGRDESPTVAPDLTGVQGQGAKQSAKATTPKVKGSNSGNATPGPKSGMGASAGKGNSGH